jgi:hypothetical protein
MRLSVDQGGDLEIHHVVLKRMDGSELRRNFLAGLGDAPRFGSMIQLAISDDAFLRVQAKITAVQTISLVSRGGNHRPAELTVQAQEVMCVPVADNDP